MSLLLSSVAAAWLYYGTIEACCFAVLMASVVRLPFYLAELNHD